LKPRQFSIGSGQALLGRQRAVFKLIKALLYQTELPTHEGAQARSRKENLTPLEIFGDDPKRKPT